MTANTGYCVTGRLGPGSAWCWLTRSGLIVTGLGYAPSRPTLGRLAHIRAVLAVRLSLQASDANREGWAWWRSERRIRAAIGGRAVGHVPDAEVSWPEVPGSPYAGECWALEAELTPKSLARTVAIMTALGSRTDDYGPETVPGPGPRNDRVVHLAAPAARGVTKRAAASLLQGAMAAAALGDNGRAGELIAAARDVARFVPVGSNHYRLAFGPVNVVLHEVAALATLGENGRAVQIADSISGERLRSLRKERRAALMVDTARACSQGGQRDEALRRLLAAEQIAAPEVRCRPVAQAAIADLLHRCHGSPSFALAGLAQRAGVRP